MSEDSRELLANVRSVPANPPEKTLNLSTNSVDLDLTGLSDQQVQALKIKHAELAIKSQDKGRQMGLDAQAIAATLNVFSQNAGDMSEKGLNVTMTNTRDDSMGRTEIIVGNTDAAKSGKLTRSQQGLPDGTLIWMAFALAFLVIAGIIASVVV